MWHDHSSISGHSHLLVVVTPIYDPAFYYSPDEMEERTGVRVDVPTLVEHPEIHIIARSGSSLSDQSLFNMCRQECLQGLSDTICTKDGIPIRDVVRFFSRRWTCTAIRSWPQGRWNLQLCWLWIEDRAFRRLLLLPLCHEKKL